MTPEQKREQLLKRLLPGLAMTVIYFVFVSGMMSEKMHKAEESYQNLIRQGVSASALPGAQAQVGQTGAELGQLQQKQNEYRAKLKDLAGFLMTGGAPSNEATALLSRIFAGQGLRVLEEKREAFPESGLSQSLQEVLLLLQPTNVGAAKKAGPPEIFVEHVWLQGRYLAMHKALAEIAESELPAVPVALTMRMPETQGAPADELQWELLLWM